MANQRLGILMKKADVQYAEGSPILLEACALYRDNVTNSCIAQLKWKNIDSHQIRAIMIDWMFTTHSIRSWLPFIISMMDFLPLREQSSVKKRPSSFQAPKPSNTMCF